MRLIPIEIVARAPLAFPERKPGVQFRTSLPYVPGGAIYGALGMLLGQEWADTTEAFAALFRHIRCHNAYPALPGDPWVHPLPMTAIQPKSGKKQDLGEQPAYKDSLYARVCWEQQQPTALIYTPTDNNGRPWEAAERTFYTLEDANKKPWTSGRLDGAKIGRRNVTQRVLTRVSINRRRGTAEDTRLYSPLVISEVMEDRDKQLTNTRFSGSIIIPDDERILPALARITHLGGRQTTGIGAVRINEQQTARPIEDTAVTISNRVDAMTVRFQKQAELYQMLGGATWRPNVIFTVNLLSDAILFDQGWLPTNELTGDILQAATGVEARLLRSFTTTTTVGGWNVSWQRPKPTAVATIKGSVFVFQAEKLQPHDYEALVRLQADGIGERRAEGYGQVRICDEFHLLPASEGAL